MSIRRMLPVVALAVCACSPPPTDEEATQTDRAEQDSAASQVGTDVDTALEQIDETEFRQRVETLAGDDFGGRAPFSEGEQKTLDYLTDAFRAAGFQPANGDSYLQPVELVSLEADQNTVMTLAAGDETRELSFGEDMVVWTKRVAETSELDQSQLVFVGYGVVAPEYGWDDYAGIDMRGKTAVILVNDPGYATQDPERFNGNAMTYYGRWTYKYEEAARQGAAGAIVVHETGAAGYPWEVVSGSWAGPQFDLATPDGNEDRVAIEGWITQARASELFDALALDYAALLEQAASGELEPTPLEATISVAVSNRQVKSKSYNVAAILPGSEAPDEVFVYMAHWDHLGTAQGMEGDNIFNGAVDNATGTAGLVELAQAFAALPEPPRRSVLMLAVTAEESGLLGSRHYGDNPLYPLANTVGGINIDAMNVLGRTRDIVVIGKGSSELEEYLAAAAEKQSRVLVQEPTPEKGFFYRSDHFNFAKRGVPVLYAEGGVDYLDHTREWGLKQQADYTANRYHKPDDEFDADWDLSGAIEDLRLYFNIGLEVAEGEDWPNWYEGNEFRAIRDRSRQSAAPSSSSSG